LFAAQWTEDGWQKRSAQRTNKGRKKSLCSMCGKSCYSQPAGPLLAYLCVINAGRYTANVEWKVRIDPDDTFCRLCKPSAEYPYIGWRRFDLETRDWLTNYPGNYSFPPEGD